MVDVASNVIYASGYLLYARGGILMAQPFDAEQLATTGPAVPLVDDLRWDERFSRGVFAASQNGVLVCLNGRTQTLAQLLWLDRSGRRLESAGEPADYTFGGTPAISPDGSRALMAIQNPDLGSSAVWVVDLATGRRRKLTVDGKDHPACAWSHDGRHAVVNCFSYGGKISATFVRLALDGSGVDTVTSRPGWLYPTSASPDGRYILFDDSEGPGVGDLQAAPLSGGGPVFQFAKGSQSQFSPNGRFVAYTSTESGRDQVYVVTFPEPGGKWQVSQDGGGEARWGRDGKTLYFVDRENHVVAVDVTVSASGFEPGEVRPLFQLHTAGGFWRYDVSPDGSRFLVTVPLEDEARAPVLLMTDWTAKLRKR